MLEEYIPDKTQKIKTEIVVTSSNPVMIPLSAKNKDRLQAYAKKLLAFIQGELLRETEEPKINLVDLAYTLQVGREAMEER